MRRLLPALLLPLVMMAAAPVQAQASSCTSTLRAGANIGAAVGAAANGDTICLSGGTYGRAWIEAQKADVILTAVPGETPVVQGIMFTASSGITVRGLEITRDGVGVRGGDGLVIENNRIHETVRADGCPGWPASGSGYGIHLAGWRDVEARNHVIRDNLIEDLPHDAIFLGAVENILVERNEIRGIYVIHPECDHSDSIQIMYALDVTIRRNYIHDNLHGIMMHGPSASVRRNVSLENNLMHGTNGIGFNLYSTENLKVVNNTIWDTEFAGMRLRNQTDDATQMSATVRNNITDGLTNECGSCAVLSNNIAGVSPGLAANYGLAPGSQAINSGTIADAPTIDRLGRSRDGHPDIGAHEFQDVAAADDGLLDSETLLLGVLLGAAAMASLLVIVVLQKLSRHPDV